VATCRLVRPAHFTVCFTAFFVPHLDPDDGGLLFHWRRPSSDSSGERPIANPIPAQRADILSPTHAARLPIRNPQADPADAFHEQSGDDASLPRTVAGE